MTLLVEFQFPMEITLLYWTVIVFAFLLYSVYILNIF